MKINTLEKHVDQQLENWANAYRDQKKRETSGIGVDVKLNKANINVDEAENMEQFMLDLKFCYPKSYWALFHRHIKRRTNQVIRFHVGSKKPPSISIVIKLLECGEHFLGRCFMEEHQKNIDRVGPKV